MARAEREEAREKEKLKRQQQEWGSRYKALTSECCTISRERELFESCKKQLDATCSPKRFSNMNNCLDEQVRISGPTDKDACKLMKKTWDDRSKNGSSITSSILDLFLFLAIRSICGADFCHDLLVSSNDVRPCDPDGG